MLAGLHAILVTKLLQQGLLQQRCAGSCACGSAFAWVQISVQQCVAVQEPRGPALSPCFQQEQLCWLCMVDLAGLHAQEGDCAWCAHRRW